MVTTGVALALVVLPLVVLRFVQVRHFVRTSCKFDGIHMQHLTDLNLTLKFALAFAECRGEYFLSPCRCLLCRDVCFVEMLDL